MKKLIFQVLAFSLIIISCNEKESVELEDVSKEFSKNLSIRGAVRVNGDIPKPEVGDFGFTPELTQDKIGADPYSGFSIEFTSPQEDGLAFLKIDKTNEYFQIEFDKNGIIDKGLASIIKPNARVNATFKFPNKFVGHCILPGIQKANVNATIQICIPPKVNGKLDKSKLNEKKYWCPAKKITFNLKPFDCNLQRTGEEFIALSNFILSSDFSENDCEYVKAKYDQLVKAMLTCKEIKESDKSQLTSLNQQMQSIDCSIFDLNAAKGINNRVIQILNN